MTPFDPPEHPMQATVPGLNRTGATASPEGTQAMTDAVNELMPPVPIDTGAMEAERGEEARLCTPDGMLGRQEVVTYLRRLGHGALGLGQSHSRSTGSLMRRLTLKFTCGPQMGA